ncbi:MAG: hypothetical protein KF696_03085 [Planctomycetes bacterium]|nr:hypothetical protein [Planctomycetota bacterium]MCW8134990.1 hypothetical protein [Planctomycetota bacterium]
MTVLLVVGCASGPPARDAAWWQAEVKRDRPNADDDGRYHPRGNMDREIELDAGEDVEVRWVEVAEGNNRRAVHVGRDGKGYIIITETWDDDGKSKSIMRKLSFRLDDGDMRELRGLVSGSGVLRLNPEFAGEGSRGWRIWVRCGDDVRSVYCDKGYPGEGTRFVQGLYDLVVQPRAAEIGKASRFSDDPATADEFLALR